MLINHTETPVLVLGAAEHGSLGIIRSLGRLGIPVYVVEPDPPGPASFSRYCRRIFTWDLNSSSEQDSIATLRDIGRHFETRCILVPTWDEVALLVDRHRSELAPYFIYPEQPLGLVRSLSSKVEMFAIAQSCGIPTPKIMVPGCVAELHAFIETATFPVVIKRIFGNLVRRGAPKMSIVNSPDELVREYHAMVEPGRPNLLLQEFIPGGDDSVWMFNGYFNDHSDCLAGFTGRKLRQTPIHTGMTSLGICLRNDNVDRMSRRFMKQIGYRGMLDMGYRYDARDGQYKVLDVNPRIGATFRLFVDANGLDVVRAMYLDVTGQPVPDVSVSEGRKWMVERDFKSCYDYYREGSLTITEWLHSLRGISEFGYMAWDDPRPVLRIGTYLFQRSRRRAAAAEAENLSAAGTDAGAQTA